MSTSKRKTASPLTDLPDHLLTEILLRLPAPADLARFSAPCVSFRRLATERSLLRRFRCLHEPPLLGFLERDGFHPALPPHPSAPAARALALAADFSFSFLPSHCRWTVRDCRDGRVLLNSGLTALCLPGARRMRPLAPSLHPSFLRRHYACGCFYWDWVIIRSEKLLVLDIRRMEFSIANLPPGDWSKKGVGIVEAGEGRLGIFGFDGDFTSHLSYAIARNKGNQPYLYIVYSLMNISQWTPRRCSFRGFVPNNYCLCMGHTYIPTSHHRCCLHGQYEVIRCALRQICLPSSKPPWFR
ncbi:hypothetical protein VPH35_132582 [Triticum aestivum]